MRHSTENIGAYFTKCTGKYKVKQPHRLCQLLVKLRWSRNHVWCKQMASTSRHVVIKHVMSDNISEIYFVNLVSYRMLMQSQIVDWNAYTSMYVCCTSDTHKGLSEADTLACMCANEKLRYQMCLCGIAAPLQVSGWKMPTNMGEINNQRDAELVGKKRV